MKLNYILISLLLTLQSYSVYALQNHPLAILLDIDDKDVPECFGGTYINIFNEKITVNTVDFSKVDDELLALPQIKPYNNSLYFKEANNSLSQLKNNFVEISLLSKLKHAKNLYILTEWNIIILFYIFFDKQDSNTEFLNDVKPFNPTIFYFNQEETTQTIRRDVDNSKREISNKLLSGDGVYNRANNGRCSVGFWQ
ncbi:hypothetical protein F8M41_013793 [Gigaspora margarita]|uniref:Uncharacterized protein n=1 Tax=Gigaspora margarita TaxID=4874 RepID=A0A8H4ARZ6_GIGMA|nr:hypothetical protein F8M41_013793 [Gigaspora margarita]